MHNNVADLISANGCWLRNQDTIYFKATIISFKKSGQRRLEMSSDWSYGKNQLNVPKFKTHNNYK